VVTRPLVAQAAGVAMWVESCGVFITGCMVAVRHGAHCSHNGMCSTSVGRAESVQYVVPTSLQFGRTAMDRARENGHMEIVEMIKRHSYTH